MARSEERRGTVVIRGCSVLDVAEGKLLANRTVILAAGKLLEVGTPEVPVDAPPAFRAAHASPCEEVAGASTAN
jgi:hypothetical protein